LLKARANDGLATSAGFFAAATFAFALAGGTGLRALCAGSAVFALTPRAMGSTPLRGRM
jgi:hypothetical protein